MKIPTIKVDGVFYVLVEVKSAMDSCLECSFTDETGDWCNKLRRKISDVCGDDADRCICDGSYQYQQLEVQDLPDADTDNAPEILTGVNK